MKDVEEFKEFISIDFNEEHQEFGHYPFQLVAIDDEDKLIMNSLALGGDVISCYMSFAKYIASGYKKVYMSVDFPATMDMETDFVAVLSWENGRMDLVGLPYDNKTGEKLPELKGESKQVFTTILKQFAIVVFGRDEKVE